MLSGGVIDAVGVLGWTTAAIAVWSTISSLQWLARVRDYRSGGVLGWDLLTLHRDRSRSLAPLAPFFASRTNIALPLIRLAAGIALPCLAGWALVAALATVAVCTLALGLMSQGGDGSDKMALVATTGAALIAAGQDPRDSLLATAGIAWIAGQLAIAYCTAGVAKLVLPFWRDGSAVGAAMASYTSGHRWSAAVVAHPARARAIAWAVMLPEALFPLAFFLPQPVMFAALAFFALFHLATAVLMGLNTYPWAFVAAYPAALAANAAILRAIG